MTVDYYGRIFVAGGSDADGIPSAAIYLSQELNQPDAAPVITGHSPRGHCWASPVILPGASTGNPQPTYNLTTFPAGMTIDPVTGRIQWTPTLAEVGSQNVVVQASNPVGQSSGHASFSITARSAYRTSLTVLRGACSQPTQLVRGVGNRQPDADLHLDVIPCRHDDRPSVGTVKFRHPRMRRRGRAGLSFTVQAPTIPALSAKRSTWPFRHQFPRGLRPRVPRPARSRFRGPRRLIPTW